MSPVGQSYLRNLYEFHDFLRLVCIIVAIVVNYVVVSEFPEFFEPEEFSDMIISVWWSIAKGTFWDFSKKCIF